jgi:hypothetical protein
MGEQAARGCAITLTIDRAGRSSLIRTVERWWWRWRWQRRVDAVLRAELAACAGAPGAPPPAWHDPAVQAVRTIALRTLERLTWDGAVAPGGQEEEARAH